MTAAAPDLGVVFAGARYRYAGSQRFALDGVDLVRPPRRGRRRHRRERRRQEHALPGRRRSRAGHDRRVSSRDRSRSMASRPARRSRTSTRSRRGSCSRTPRRSCRARTATSGRRSRSGRETWASRWPTSSRASPRRWPALRIEHLAERDPQRLSGGQAQLVALAAVVALRPALPDPRRADEPARPAGDAPRRRRPGLDRRRGPCRASCSSSTRPTCSTGCARASWSCRAGGRSAMARRPVVLARSRAPRAGRRAAGASAPGRSARGRRSVDRCRRAGRGRGLTAAGRVLPPSASKASASSTPTARGPCAASRSRSPPGERVAIVGQNGSGKSTLVRQLNGLLRPTEGRVTVEGREVGRRHVAELARSVGLAFQNPDRQIFAGRVRREVEFGPKNLGVRGDQLADGRRRGARPRRTHGRRRHQPVRPRLFAPEAARARVDPRDGDADRGPRRADDRPGRRAGSRGSRRSCATWPSAGRTVIAISHDMRFVAETFARVVVMRAGEVALDGPPAEVFAERNWETLASTFLEPAARGTRRGPARPDRRRDGRRTGGGARVARSGDARVATLRSRSAPAQGPRAPAVRSARRRARGSRPTRPARRAGTRRCRTRSLPRWRSSPARR